ncbi:MAG: hypothetical protein M3Y80_02495 [Verrucomicrobiota bacterium]|nr:hypothetical protein [Verrucomicrobiota bacterium]
MKSATFLLLALLLAFAGCKSQSQQIAGKWAVQGGANPVVWEFAPNGSARMGGSVGRYTFGDRNRLKIQTPFATFIYEIELSGDTMTWKDPKGTRTELKRIP